MPNRIERISIDESDRTESAQQTLNRLLFWPSDFIATGKRARQSAAFRTNQVIASKRLKNAKH